MKIAIGAVGHLKSGPEKELAADYEGRIRAIGRQAGVTGIIVKEWSESRAAQATERISDEATELWGIVGDGPVVVLDERGKAKNSEEFAYWLEKQASQGHRQVTFLLGGPDGHDAESRVKADLVMSFGPMTFPHRLARIMLLEQIYRALTILVNHPYHRP
jgi:23S rRNA (pseudouridine1915-N3)-methyltransferase